MSENSKKLEALLFFKGEAVPVDDILSVLDINKDEFKEALAQLETDLSDRGLSIIELNDQVKLSTDPEYDEVISKAHKEELNKDLSKAALETLSIILYYSPVSKATMDYIRGVNTQAILRNLSVRGLISKEYKKQEGVTYYKPTIDLYENLGIKDAKELPEYEKVRKELENTQNEE